MIRGLLESRGLIHDWRASTAEILQRHFGDDEAAKFAIAANVGYYADDPDRLAWPVFAMAQGGYLKAGGRYIKGGSRVLSMKLAKVVMTQGGSVLLGREARGIDFDSSGRPAFVRHADAQDEGGRTAHRGEAGLRQLRAACSRAHAAGRRKGEDRTRLYQRGRCRPRCSRRISGSTSRRRRSASTATA